MRHFIDFLFFMFTVIELKALGVVEKEKSEKRGNSYNSFIHGHTDTDRQTDKSQVVYLHEEELLN